MFLRRSINAESRGFWGKSPTPVNQAEVVQIGITLSRTKNRAEIFYEIGGVLYQNQDVCQFYG